MPALAHLRDGDVAYTTHRNHGHLIARGVEPAGMAAEILGKATGINRGKGGTLHLASLRTASRPPRRSVGGPLPIAVGSAFAFKELGLDRVSVALFGDGALEEGAWHESVNIAAMRKVPVIFLCENNSLEALGQKANEYPSSTLAAARADRPGATRSGCPRWPSTAPTRAPSTRRWGRRWTGRDPAADPASSRRVPSAGQATGRSGRSC